MKKRENNIKGFQSDRYTATPATPTWVLGENLDARPTSKDWANRHAKDLANAKDDGVWHGLCIGIPAGILISIIVCLVMGWGVTQ